MLCAAGAERETAIRCTREKFAATGSVRSYDHGVQHVRVMICPRCGETVRIEENPPTGRPPSSPDDPGAGVVHVSSLEIGVKRQDGDGFETARGVEIRFNGARV